MNKNVNNRLGELDALRGIAAIMVVLFHATMLDEHHTFKYGTVGVELFFIISGFVIFMTINKVSSGKEFIIKRFARLYPIYWVCVSLTFVLHLISNPSERGLMAEYFVNLTMLQRYFNFSDLDGQYWSLAVELAFYVFIFVIYKLRLLRRTEIIFLIMVLAEFGLMVARRIKEGPNAPSYFSPTEHLFGIFHFLPLFLAGIAFYKIYTEGASVSRYALIAFCYVAQVWEYPNRHVDMYDLMKDDYSIALCIIFLLFIMFVNHRLSFIVNKATLFLGRISYALYLFHQYVMINFIIPFIRSHFKWPYFVSTLCPIIIVVAIAAINTISIDEPLRNKIKDALIKKPLVKPGVGK